MLIFLGFAAWAFIVNHDIHTSWLFIDDLIEWYCAQGEGLKSYLFDGDPSHFRPVLRVLQWFEVHLIDNHLGLIIPINLCILIVTTIIMYLFMRRLSGSRLVAVLLAGAFECARFSYYSVSQLLGVIESVPLLLGLLVCILLYVYMHGYGEKNCTAGQNKYTLEYGADGASEHIHDDADARQQGGICMACVRPGCFIAAIVCYVMACFIHERYMVLMPMFFYAVLARYLLDAREYGLDTELDAGSENTGKPEGVAKKIVDDSTLELKTEEKKGRPWLELLAAMAAFAFVQILRYKTLGTLVPAGTAGTTIAETFSVKRIITNVLQQLAYLFGINAGPIHLCGVTWLDTAPAVKVLTVLMGALIVYVLIHFFSVVFAAERSRKDGSIQIQPDWAYKSESRELLEVSCRTTDPRVCGEGNIQQSAIGETCHTECGHTGRSWCYLADVIFFAGFIIGYIAASSVTVRVELRWVYASWGMCCILLSYVSGVTMREKPDMRIFIKAAACGTAVISIICSIYYRSGFKDVYLFEEQARRESLIGQTYEKYGEDIFHKDIYIIGNFYQVTEFEERHMLAPHQPLGQERCMNIIHVAKPEDVPNPESEDTIVLYEDPVDDTYKVYEYEKQKKDSANYPGN